MRKHLITFIFLIAAVALMSTKCEKEDKTDECKPYEMPSITRDFVIWANIIYLDSVPFTYEVIFNIKKTYCDGTIRGDYWLDHIDADDNGDWFSGMTYTYDFGNKRDKITISFDFYNPLDIEQWVVTYDLFYEDVEFAPVLLNFDIILPWNKPTTK
jgi:hypothetical protein